MEMTVPTKEERNLAMLCHIGPAAVGLLTAGGGGWLVPLVIWLMKKDESEFVVDQAKESLNFQITVFIAAAISAILIFVLIGLVLLPLVMLGALILTILAGMKASEGVRYRYPFALRLIA